MKPTVLNAFIIVGTVATTYAIPFLLSQFVWVHLWWTCIPCSMILAVWAKERKL